MCLTSHIIQLYGLCAIIVFKLMDFYRNVFIMLIGFSQVHGHQHYRVNMIFERLSHLCTPHIQLFVEQCISTTDSTTKTREVF